MKCLWDGKEFEVISHLHATLAGRIEQYVGHVIYGDLNLESPILEQWAQR